MANNAFTARTRDRKPGEESERDSACVTERDLREREREREREKERERERDRQTERERETERERQRERECVGWDKNETFLNSK